MHRLLPCVVALAAVPSLSVAQVAVTTRDEIRALVAAISAKELEASVRTLVGFGTRHTLSTTTDPARGIGAARTWIEKRFAEIAAGTNGRMTVTLDRHRVPPGPRVPTETEVVNVVATLRGRDPERFVIVSGHYDSRASAPNDATADAPGADDDASGTAVVIEAARVMAGLDPRATIVFLCVAGEEQGLLGADAFARAARAEGRRIDAMLTNDIVGGVVGSIGRREKDRVRLFSEGIQSGPKDKDGRPPSRPTGSDNDAPSRELARYLEARGEAYVPGFDVTLIFRQDRFLRGGDHKAFNDHGYAAVRFTEVHENYDRQHQDVREEAGRSFGDLPDHLDYDFVRKVCAVNVAGLAELALAPAPPKQVRVITAGLTPHTEIRFQPGDEQDLAGHAVLYRRTHEPTWTWRRIVAKGETSVLIEGMSKDDWYFALEAVDQDGRASLPIFPLPAQR